MALIEKKLFKHGGSWAIDLPMRFARELEGMSVVIEETPDGFLIKPKTELETMEADPLFQRFVEAIVMDAMEHPEKLHDAREVWDDEWANLLQGVDVDEV